VTDISSTKTREVVSRENVTSIPSTSASELSSASDLKNTFSTPKDTPLCELNIDFGALRKTVASIDHQETKKITNATLDACEKRAIAFNQDVQNPLMAEKLMDELTELEKMVMNDEAAIKRASGDSTSLHRAQAVLDYMKKASIAAKAQLIPSSAPITVDAQWQLHRLRMEQQLLSSAPLQQPFNTALEKIAAKARLDHNIPKGIFICYAKPDEKDPHLQWVVPFLEHLRSHLQMAGFSKTKLDTKDSAMGEAKHLYLKEIETDDFVLLIGTPTLCQQYEAQEPALLTALNCIQRKKERRPFNTEVQHPG